MDFEKIFKSLKDITGEKKGSRKPDDWERGLKGKKKMFNELRKKKKEKK